MRCDPNISTFDVVSNLKRITVKNAKGFHTKQPGFDSAYAAYLLEQRKIGRTEMLNSWQEKKS